MITHYHSSTSVVVTEVSFEEFLLACIIPLGIPVTMSQEEHEAARRALGWPVKR